jgi:hypothetical protein
MHPTLDEQGDMGIRTQTSVGDQDVLRSSSGMDFLDLCQLVRQQGGAHQLGQEASPRMEEGQQADDGEATAGALLGGLPKLCLQYWGIRHGAARAVDKKRPMSMPAAFLGDGGLDRLA